MTAQEANELSNNNITNMSRIFTHIKEAAKKGNYELILDLRSKEVEELRHLKYTVEKNGKDFSISWY